MSRINSYAGIGKRCVASLIDGIILIFAFVIVYGKEPIIKLLDPFYTPNLIDLIYSFFTGVLGWIYFAGMESSGLQATFGKKILGIIVTDPKGNKISFWRAAGRYFAKSSFFIVWILGFIIAVIAEIDGDESPYWVVVGLLFLVGILVLIIGYVMAAFTPEKQALHDILARCLVVNGRGQSTAIPWKILMGLVIAAIISERLIDSIPDICEIDPTLSECQPNPCETNPTLPGCPEFPGPEAKKFLNEMPDPPGRNPNIPTSGRFNLCGSEEKLTEIDNVVVNADYKFEFSKQGVTHVVRIKMQRNSGIMRVVFPDNSEASGLGKVQQTMQVYRWPQEPNVDLVIRGFEPVNPDTGNTANSYPIDNFLIKDNDGSPNVRTCDDWSNTSPVTVERYVNY